MMIRVMLTMDRGGPHVTAPTGRTLWGEMRWERREPLSGMKASNREKTGSQATVIYTDVEKAGLEDRMYWQSGN